MNMSLKALSSSLIYFCNQFFHILWKFSILLKFAVQKLGLILQITKFELICMCHPGNSWNASASCHSILLLSVHQVDKFIHTDIEQKNGFHAFNFTDVSSLWTKCSKMLCHHKWVCNNLWILKKKFALSIHQSGRLGDQHKCDHVHNLYRKHINVYSYINFSSGQREHEFF